MNKIIERQHHLLPFNQVHVFQQAQNVLKPYLHGENYRITPYNKVFG